MIKGFFETTREFTYVGFGFLYNLDFKQYLVIIWTGLVEPNELRGEGLNFCSQSKVSLAFELNFNIKSCY